MKDEAARPFRVPAGAVAVVFVSQRTPQQGAEYGAAAEAMMARASKQPGYLGIDSARDTDGFGITVSYWRTEKDAIAWRGDAEHTLIRNQGRAGWYEWYSLHVAEVARSYIWRRGEGEPPRTP
jgi:heme-degrading monooxygenase HmoA